MLVVRLFELAIIKRFYLYNKRELLFSRPRGYNGFRNHGKTFLSWKGSVPHETFAIAGDGAVGTVAVPGRGPGTATKKAASSQPESVVSSPVETPSPSSTPFTSSQEENSLESPIQTGVTPEQVLEGETGEIHYIYYLPENYDPSQEYPLVMAMPGYDRMWFGEDSSGSNLDWPGFLCWTQLEEDMIVVSAQLTDWAETSARQAIELTEYFIGNYAVDESRVYATGYSAGGETMSRAVALRPDLYAGYLRGASQWDGDFAPVAENGVAMYIFMAENDEYYGSGRGKHTPASTKPMWTWDGRKMTSAVCCGFKRRTTLGSQSGASPATTTAAPR